MALYLNCIKNVENKVKRLSFAMLRARLSVANGALLDCKLGLRGTDLDNEEMDDLIIRINSINNEAQRVLLALTMKSTTNRKRTDDLKGPRQAVGRGDGMVSQAPRLSVSIQS